MNKKSFWYPLIAALLSIGILYTLGNHFDISFLSWTMHKENPSGGMVFEAQGSLIPIIIGCIIGFVTERIYKHKHT